LKCKICGVRRARRFCPGVEGDICSICCGTERENTVRCPFTCVYLREARQHERVEPVDRETLPNSDIRVSDEYLDAHVEQFNFIGAILVRSALMEPGTVDRDVRDALDALTRTYRTLQSGLYYDTRPENAIAARIFDDFQEGMGAWRKEEQQHGLPHASDGDVLKILVFLQIVAISVDNGRPLCRALIDTLRNLAEAPQAENPPLIYTV